MAAYTQADLQSHLEALGVEAGDMLFIHSSFKSLGPVVGGAQTVVDALPSAIWLDSNRRDQTRIRSMGRPNDTSRNCPVCAERVPGGMKWMTKARRWRSVWLGGV